MTRQQWRNISIGDSVKINLPWPDAKVTLCTMSLIGKVIMPNSNRSKVLVKWEDNNDLEFWYERKTIELRD